MSYIPCEFPYIAHSADTLCPTTARGTLICLAPYLVVDRKQFDGAGALAVL